MCRQTVFPGPWSRVSWFLKLEQNKSTVLPSVCLLSVSLSVQELNHSCTGDLESGGKLPFPAMFLETEFHNRKNWGSDNKGEPSKRISCGDHHTQSTPQTRWSKNLPRGNILHYRSGQVFTMETQKVCIAEPGGDVVTEARCHVALKVEGTQVKDGWKQ